MAYTPKSTQKYAKSYPAAMSEADIRKAIERRFKSVNATSILVEFEPTLEAVAGSDIPVAKRRATVTLELTPDSNMGDIAAIINLDLEHGKWDVVNQPLI
jgi:hypothetical protein